MLINMFIFLSIINNRGNMFQKLILHMIILLISSFTHVETTIFFIVIYYIFSLLLFYGQDGKKFVKKLIMINLFNTITIVPSILFYYSHMLSLTSLTEGLIVYNPLTSLFQFVKYLGILVVPSVLGLIVISRLYLNHNIDDKYYLFVYSWGIFSFFVSIIQYFNISLQTFSERALILFPSPFLAGVGLKFFLKDRFDVRNKKYLIPVFLVLASIMFSYSIPVFQRIFISHSSYEQLVWLSDNIDSSFDPIFIINDYDNFVGEKGDMYDNWIQAVYGDHFTYLGLPIFYLSGVETPFHSLKSHA